MQCAKPLRQTQRCLHCAPGQAWRAGSRCLVDRQHGGAPTCMHTRKRRSGCRATSSEEELALQSFTASAGRCPHTSQWMKCQINSTTALSRELNKQRLQELTVERKQHWRKRARCCSGPCSTGRKRWTPYTAPCSRWNRPSSAGHRLQVIILLRTCAEQYAVCKKECLLFAVTGTLCSCCQILYAV